MRKLAVWSIAALIAAAGCIGLRPNSAYDSPSSYEYQPGFGFRGSPWIGRTSDDLIAVLGEPDVILEISRFGADARYGEYVVAYVYNMDRNSTTTCTDAYVVAKASGRIVNYHCR